MSNHEISFNTKLSDPIRTRTDFTYKITSTTISIVDTGLGQRSVNEDIEAVLRKIRNLLAAFSRSGYPESSRQLSRHRSIDKFRLKIGHYNRQTSMYEPLVETLEMV